MTRALLFLLLLSAPAVAGAQSSALLKAQFDSVVVPPPATNRPIPLRVGLYVLNLVALDEVGQTFTCTGYLTETWSDSRLAFSPGAGAFRRYYQKKDVWFPLLQFDNSTESRKLSGYLLFGNPYGVVNYIEKFSVKLSSNMQLRAFPFDSQDLEIVVHPFMNPANQIVLSIDPRNTGISAAPYTPLPLWKTGRVTYGTVPAEAEQGDRSLSHLAFRVHVVRNSEYYVYRIFLPLTLMVAVSWGVLWIPPGDLNSQLLISVTTVLTLVAFSVALSNILPPVPYLTFYDLFFLVSFFFILLTIAESLLVHAIHNSAGRDSALKVRRATRLLFPIAFVVMILALGAVFLE